MKTNAPIKPLRWLSGKYLLICGILSFSLILSIQGRAENAEAESYKYLSKTKEYKALIERLKKNDIAFCHILGRDSETGFVTIEVREEKEEHTVRLEMFLYDPKTKKCFVQNPADLTLKEIEK